MPGGAEPLLLGSGSGRGCDFNPHRKTAFGNRRIEELQILFGQCGYGGWGHGNCSGWNHGMESLDRRLYKGAMGFEYGKSSAVYAWENERHWIVRLHGNHLSGGGIKSICCRFGTTLPDSLGAGAGKLCADCKRGRSGTEGEELRRSSGIFCLWRSGGKCCLSNGSDRQRLYGEKVWNKLCWQWGIRSAVSGMEDKSVYINVLSTTGERKKSQEEIEAAAAEFLPAHAKWVFDFGVLSWDYIDAKENTFDQMDRADLAWSEIDGYTETAE